METILKSLRIINFIEHDDLKVDFHPNVNFIIGETGVGKTTLFHAILLITSNSTPKPREIFAKDQTKDFKIILDTNIAKITRTEKKYKIKWHNSNHKQEFTAFGREVPEPIKKILNLQSVNWQHQLFPNYIVLDKGSSIAKELSKELGTEDSEKIIKEIKSNISSTKSEYKILNSKIEDAEKTISKLKYIKEYKKEFDKIKKHKINIEKISKKFNELDELLFVITKLYKQLQMLEPINIFLKNLELINKRIKHISELEIKLEKLEKIITILHNIPNIDYGNLNKINAELNDYIELYKEKNNLVKDQFQLLKLIEHIEDLKIVIHEQTIDYNKSEKEFYNSIKICPLCNRKG